ncbi:MAG: LUD domain-containing protein [Actinomycetota bacterium]
MDIDQSLLDLWDGFPDVEVRERVLSCAQALAGRDFGVVPVPTSSEANKVILGLIDRRNPVYFWEAAALDELGILETLQARGNSVKRVVPLLKSRRPWRRWVIPRGAIYLSTVCAVTSDGMLVKVEPEGLPVFQPKSGPRLMLLVAGFNSIVDGLADGFRRAKDVCVPHCAARIGLELPCARDELCVECAEPPPLCSVNTVITHRPSEPDIKVILIGERV